MRIIDADRMIYEISREKFNFATDNFAELAISLKRWINKQPTLSKEQILNKLNEQS